MATYGKIDEFDRDSDSWEQYIERLNFYFEANGVTTSDDDWKIRRAILLSSVGKKTYKLMSDLLAPAKPGEKSYADLCTLVKSHFNPKPSESVQRHKFNNRFRLSGENVSDFVAALRNMAEYCNFGGSLENMLRDRLVSGINNERIQRRLLSEENLTFKKAYDIASSMETTAQHMADLQSAPSTLSSTSASVKKVSSSPLPRSKSENKECYRCGKNHHPSKCRFKEATCHYCKKKGHIVAKCLKKAKKSSETTKPNSNHHPKQGKPAIHVLDTDKEIEDEDIYPLFAVSQGNRQNPYLVDVELNGLKVQMELDTGASLSVIGEDIFDQLKNIEGSSLNLQDTKLTLKTYTGETIPVLGKLVVEVKYKDFFEHLPVIVVQGKVPSLFGRDWLQHVKLSWPEIFLVQVVSPDVSDLLKKHENLFKEGLGTIQGVKAKIYVDPQAKPKYFKPRTLEYARRQKVERELDRLLEEGTIRPVQFSEWATPIVPIVKSDESIRICGDFKVTLNQVSKLDNYPIPKTEDLLAQLGGGVQFTKLDLSQAYQQLELDEESKKYTTITTHKGLFEYNRLCYGIASAPGIFQRTMENLLQGIPNVVVRIDDILIAGKTSADHLKSLTEVLSRLDKAGVRLKRSKCIFQAPEVTYLGHRIDKDGIHPLDEKIKAIQESPRPSNLKELQAFLGMLNYYACYIPNITTILSPLHQLLVKDTPWNWSEAHEKSWNQAKSTLHSSQLLVHYSLERELTLACDASPYGLGCVISHVMDDGTERPISYASRTLSPAEKNYSQLDKEAAAIMFGVRKFHSYLYGRSFTIYTDHKPLLGLLQSTKQIPTSASPRILRWAVFLSGYSYTLVYREGQKNGNADGLSRLPLPNETRNVPVPGDIMFVMNHLEVNTPVKVKDIKRWTSKDPILSAVRHQVMSGWPNSNDRIEFKPYSYRKHQLSCQDGCLLWGSRVVIPPQGRVKLLQELHDGHPGMVRMKMLARSYFWWPGLDADIEQKVKDCTSCQSNAKAPSTAPLHPWEWPSRPWSRIHIDYAGPFEGHRFLVIGDAYSKWIEVFKTNSSTAAVTIQKLRECFSVHGLPDIIVSDNATAFIGEEFALFMSENGIKHITSAPKHPASNGFAERYVRTFKETMKKMGGEKENLDTKLSRFLLSYRTTPHATTGKTPGELLMNRKLKTRLDLVNPLSQDTIRTRVEDKQLAQKKQHDNLVPLREFQVNDPVFVKNFSYGPKWLCGTIIQQSGPVSYVVQLSSGGVFRRHVDHLRLRTSTPTVANDLQSSTELAQVPMQTTVPKQIPEEFKEPEITVPEPSLEPKKTELPASEPASTLRRSTRLKTTPTHLKDYVC
ncbi:uncharacterized protein K02A2.6-like [Nematostella vectensis]|uniref:uncharacterized protein K02A2.6-like n=1 Tax=Nematostella vectensis TaxID=45351 RepID=UPI00207761EA|nr:uncharacterized protein K02A2.6-like [Nematostella vectensis]